MKRSFRDDPGENLKPRVEDNRTRPRGRHLAGGPHAQGIHWRPQIPRWRRAPRYLRRVADAATDPDAPDLLPSFSQPPVVEVVLGFEFQPIAEFGAIKLAQLAATWKDRYPRVQELPPLPMNPPIGTPDQFPAMFVNIGAPAIRLWLFGPADDSQLLQIQRDRLILNWRRASDDPYPHYDTLRPQFAQALTDLTRFVREQDLGGIQASAVEVSYVNEATAVGGESSLGGILRGVATADHHLGAPAASRFMQAHDARSPHDIPATLTLTADLPGRAPDSTLITLTYRGALPLDATQEDVMATMDVGHRDVVVGFAESTTDRMHQVWGRRS